MVGILEQLAKALVYPVHLAEIVGRLGFYVEPEDRGCCNI
jgi:hypothetical protein